MFNPEQHQSLCSGGGGGVGGGSGPPAQQISPRISFSSDFLMEVPAPRAAPGPPPDPNFEFLVGSHPMSITAADQLFFKGRLLPLRENCLSGGSGRGGFASGGGVSTTLRDELRGGKEDGATGGQPRDSRPPKSSSKWKEFLGLKKSRGSGGLKKIDKNEGAAGGGAGGASEAAHPDKNMQEQ